MTARWAGYAVENSHRVPASIALLGVVAEAIIENGAVLAIHLGRVQLMFVISLLFYSASSSTYEFLPRTQSVFKGVLLSALCAGVSDRHTYAVESYIRWNDVVEYSVPCH